MRSLGMDCHPSGVLTHRLPAMGAGTVLWTGAGVGAGYSARGGDKAEEVEPEEAEGSGREAA